MGFQWKDLGVERKEAFYVHRWPNGVVWICRDTQQEGEASF